MQALRESLGSRRPGARVDAVDSALTAPTRFLADRFQHVPRCTDPEFGDRLLEICLKDSVGLVIPTIDTELPAFADLRHAFAGRGVTLAVSGRDTVAIARDKNQTHEWLKANCLPAVKQATITQALADAKGWKWPLIAKPHDGSASTGLQRVDNAAELDRLAQKHADYIVQEMARGKEFTINLYVNRSGKCVCAVPHWRMEIRAGEVSKGLTVRNERLIELASRAAEALPDAWGPLNLQCFVDEDGTIAIIELNARFGGGYPLAHRAGARFTGWLLDEQEGREIPWFDGWRENLAMLRYDDAVFISGENLLSE
jgi:carbamoyl-phosphate synthase large subunit